MSTAPKSHRTTHTPGPWEVYDQGRDDGAGYGCFIRSTTDPLADWIACDIQHRPDAEFIVRACNAHDELVAALRVILKAARGDEHSECRTIRKFLDDRGVFNDDIGGSERLIAEACKYALAKAEGR